MDRHFGGSAYKNRPMQKFELVDKPWLEKNINKPLNNKFAGTQDNFKLTLFGLACDFFPEKWLTAYGGSD